MNMRNKVWIPKEEKPKIELKTSEEWQEQYPDIKVLDPDGWDRKNFKFSWYEEKISYAEFKVRIWMSTCIGKLK